MKDPKKVHSKRLKRKRKLARRVKGTGSKDRPKITRIVIQEKKKEFEQAIVEHVARNPVVRDSWITKFLKFIGVK